MSRSLQNQILCEKVSPPAAERKTTDAGRACNEDRSKLSNTTRVWLMRLQRLVFLPRLMLRGQPFLLRLVDCTAFFTKTITEDIVWLANRVSKLQHMPEPHQDLLPWLAAYLQPNPGIEPHCLEHPDGRVALLAVGPARGRPVEFRGQGYCRAGTSKTKLANHPEKARRLRGWS